MRKTWAQKMQDKATFPKVLVLQEGFPCYPALHKMGVNAGDRVVLVNASEILPIMAGVPVPRLITLREICRKIAAHHGDRGCCTLTTGIMIMTIAQAVAEAKAAGEKTPLVKVPYWRTLKAEGFLNDKYSGGQEAHKRLLQKEGFRILARGKKYQVAGFDEFLLAGA